MVRDKWYNCLVQEMVRHFVKVCRTGLKVNAGKNKVMVLNEENKLEC